MKNIEAKLSYLEENPIRRKRWAFLTDGIKNDYTRRVTEQLLENQAAHYDLKSSLGPLFEDVVTTANVDAFTTFSFPLIRRVFPRLIANDLVSVQPMTQPTGKVFYFDIEYAASAGSPSIATRRVDLPNNFIEGYSDSAGEGAQVAQLNLQISDVSVTAITKKLSAKWSLESEQDLFAYHGLSAENELMGALSDEIAREIDRYIIGQLFAYAGAGNVNWSKSGGSASPYSSLDPKVYAKTLYDAIVDANNLIVKKRYRNANWLVASADDCTRLEKLDEFRLFPAADPVGQIVYGPNLFGTISNRFTVYKDPWLAAGVMLLGFKGTTPLDTGYIYSPYVPLMTTAPFTNPDTLTTVRAMMTRFAATGVIPECYATITLTT